MIDLKKYCVTPPDPSGGNTPGPPPLLAGPQSKAPYPYQFLTTPMIFEVEYLLQKSNRIHYDALRKRLRYLLRFTYDLFLNVFFFVYGNPKVERDRQTERQRHCSQRQRYRDRQTEADNDRGRDGGGNRGRKRDRQTNSTTY